MRMIGLLVAAFAIWIAVLMLAGVGGWVASITHARVEAPIAADGIDPPQISTNARATMAAAEPNDQLQKNCSKLAAETFRREADDEDRVDYLAHYNARLNKCFYTETYISRTPVGINMWVYLSDLQENRIYGGFHRSTNIGLFYCNLQDKECHSEAEWNKLVKSYMED
jgi:hypothetical protein